MQAHTIISYISSKYMMKQEEERARRRGKRRERQEGGDVSGGSGSEDDDDEKEEEERRMRQQKQLQSLRNQLRLCRMDRRTVIENNLDHQSEVDKLLLKVVVNDNNNNQIHQSTARRHQQRIAYLEDIIRSGPEHLQMIDERPARLMREMDDLHTTTATPLL